MPSNLHDKYQIPLPRYTSYPPANYFHSGFDPEVYVAELQESNHQSPDNISVYIHIPFCPRLCHYCGCNALKLNSPEIMETYVSALLEEMNMVFRYISGSRKVSQIHFGGGTPSILPVALIESMISRIRDSFETIGHPEIAMECHPGYLDISYLDGLKQCGFNRLSLGIQDFDHGILHTVNRTPGNLPVKDLVAYIQDVVQASVNLDFIYGLPGQTPGSFLKNIQAAVSLLPERLVTFPYAHLPGMFKRQAILERRGLPSPADKIEMFDLASRFLLRSGYMKIGMDHFVRSDDELWEAQKNMQLHRNFQGYCSKRTTGQVYAFGVSAISQLAGCYTQNTKDVQRYMDLIRSGILPVEKGYRLNDREKMTRDIITNLMCNDSLNGIRYSPYVNRNRLTELEKDGIIIIENDNLRITPEGQPFVRNVAACFDPLIQ